MCGSQLVHELARTYCIHRHIHSKSLAAIMFSLRIYNVGLILKFSFGHAIAYGLENIIHWGISFSIAIKSFFFYFTLSFDVEQFYLIKKHPGFISDGNIPLHPSSSIPLVSDAETATCCLFFYFVSREVHLLPQKTLE